MEREHDQDFAAVRQAESGNGTGTEVPLGDAALDVLDAAQRVLFDRLDLFALRAGRVVAVAQTRAVIAAFAVVVLACAWIALNCTTALVLNRHLSWTTTGLAIAALDVVVGGLLLAWLRASGGKRWAS